MDFTPLHRILGVGPAPITEQMVDDAIAQGVLESDEIDWKSALPPQAAFKMSDHVKDIAAFANAAGGILVFGVSETQKAAMGRTDSGELDENYARTVQQVAYSAITPPVLGLKSFQIPTAGPDRLAAIVIPPSVDGPHLIFDSNKQAFSAPLRVNADTQWMNERLIESRYRARFEVARRGREQLEDLYADMAESFDIAQSAVLVAATRPRVPKTTTMRREMYEIAPIIDTANKLAEWWLAGAESTYSPFSGLNALAPRKALHGWTAPPITPGSWSDAQAAIFDDGSVGLAWRAGRHPYGKDDRYYRAHEVPARAIEHFAAAMLALIHTVAAEDPSGDVELLIGVEWDARSNGNNKLQVAPPPNSREGRNFATPLGGRFRHIYRLIDPTPDNTTFIQTAIDVATDCLNQVGFTKPQTLNPMLPPWRD